MHSSRLSHQSKHTGHTQFAYLLFETLGYSPSEVELVQFRKEINKLKNKLNNEMDWETSNSSSKKIMKKRFPKFRQAIFPPPIFEQDSATNLQTSFEKLEIRDQTEEVQVMNITVE